MDLPSEPKTPLLTQRTLALWAAKRTNSVEALKSVLAIRGSLGVDFAELLRGQLALGGPSAETELGKAWRLLCASIVQGSDAPRLAFLSHDEKLLSGKSLSTDLSEIANIISPSLNVRPRHDWEAKTERQNSDSVRDVVRYELATDSDTDFFASELIRRLPDWTAHARSALLDRIATALIESLDIGRDAGLVHSERFDQTDIDVPSVDPHPQNEHRHGFLPLVEVSVALMGLVSTEKARSVADRWFAAGHRLTHRLWLNALRNRLHFDAQAAINALQNTSPRLLLTIPREVPLLVRDRLRELDGPTQREFFGFVKNAAFELYPEAGAPDMQEKEDGWREGARDRALWRIFSSAKSGDVVLAQEDERLFQEIGARRPWLHHPLRDEDYFDFWVGDVRTVTGEPQLLSEVPDDQRVETAIALVQSSDSDQRETWRAYCASDPFGAMQALTREPVSERTTELWDRWMWAIPRAPTPEADGLSKNSDVAIALKSAFAHLETVSHALLDKLTYSLVQGLEAAAAYGAEVSPTWWERLWLSAEREQGSPLCEQTGYDVAGRALNTSGGRLAQYVLTSLSQHIKAGLPDDGVQDRRLQTIVESKSSAGFLGRASLMREVRFVNAHASTDTLSKLWRSAAASDLEGRLLRLVAVETVGLSQALVHKHWVIVTRAASESRAVGNSAEGVAINLLRGCFPLKDAGLRGIAGHRADVRRVLQNSTDELRRCVIDTIATWLESEAPKTRGRRWHEYYGPTFLSVWPRTAKFRSEGNTLPLARLMVATEDSFPQVFERLRPYLIPVSAQWPRLPWPIEIGRSAAKEHPDEMLSLLWALFSKPVESRRIHKLPELLSAIGEAKPALKRDRRFDALGSMKFS